MTTPSKEEVKRLADIHTNRYASRVEAALRGHPNVNLGECQAYLRIWKSVEEDGYEWLKLSPAAQRELRDAICAGE